MWMSKEAKALDASYRVIADHRCEGYDLIVAECGGLVHRVMSREDLAVEDRRDVWPRIVAALTGGPPASAAPATGEQIPTGPVGRV